MLHRFLSCLAALTLLVLATAAPAQSNRDWSKTVTLGENGAFILGNPAAKTKLVEYLSYTCPHCAHFAAEATPALKADWIRQGALSLELRNFVRDPFDLTAAILARCGGAAHFLRNHEALLANHEAWMKQADAYAHAQEGQPKREQADHVADLATKTSLIALLAKRGLAPAEQRKCLADKAIVSQVLSLTTSAWDNKDFSGTPFFILDGKPLPNVHDWAHLKPLLPTAGK